MRRTLLNLGVVFILTGIWHGARLNYVLWGAINGAIVIIERVIREKSFYKKNASVHQMVFDDERRYAAVAVVPI